MSLPEPAFEPEFSLKSTKWCWVSNKNPRNETEQKSQVLMSSTLNFGCIYRALGTGNQAKNTKLIWIHSLISFPQVSNLKVILNVKVYAKAIGVAWSFFHWHVQAEVPKWAQFNLKHVIVLFEFIMSLIWVYHEFNLKCFSEVQAMFANTCQGAFYLVTLMKYSIRTIV